MANISAATHDEIKVFNSMEWVDADTMYYGVPIDWYEIEFVFKAEEDGVIVGSISGHIEEGVLDIKDVIVAKDKRGKGIGKSLVEHVEKYAKENNAHKSHLITGIGWPVEAFYSKLGYQKVGELKNHFVHKDFAIYEKSL